MFLFHEEKIRWDEYGEMIRLEDWMMETSEGGVEEEREEEEVPDVTEVPTKCVSTRQNIHIKASVQFIDFEGRTDGDSIKKLVLGLKPRRVIVVRGNAENTRLMTEFCEELLARDQNTSNSLVFAPNTGQTVDVTTERFIYQVRLCVSVR